MKTKTIINNGYAITSECLEALIDILTIETSIKRIKFNDILFDNELQEIDMSDIDSIEFVNNSNGDGIYYITNCNGLVYACKTYEEIL